MSAALCCMLLANGACGAGWRRHAHLPLGRMDPGQQVRVWHDGAAERWHAVVLTQDSVLGVHWLEPRGCDSCRVGLARSEVDSLQVGNPMGGFWRGVGVAVLVILAFTWPWWLPG
ncbi:MAG: hypothetical protein OER90_17435 [Gemmatimonadota bacterium]|nr:hypothetical protein [Gemmatimonadota bacterium]